MKLPVVEKGVPIPPYKMRDGRNTQHHNHGWGPFLLSLRDGDSFKVAYPAASTCRLYARSLNVPLVWLELSEMENNRPVLRFWKVKA